MQRIKLAPRPDWQAKAEAVGFTWHHVSGDLYWDETAAYEFSMAEIEDGIEAPTAELHSMCLDLVDEAGVRDAAARRRDPVFAQMLRAPGRASKLGVPPDDAQVLQPVDAVSGALMLLSRPLFDRLDGLDEGYRLHAEDMDLCRRARQAGAVVAVANDIRVLHIRGVSSRARPVFVEWHKHRGLWRYFRKFEAAQCGFVTRLGVFGAIWLHFGAVLMRILLQRR